MDKILLGIVNSPHLEGMKRALIDKLISSTNKPISHEEIIEILKISADWMIEPDSSEFQIEMGHKVFQAFSIPNPKIFDYYFRHVFLASLASSSTTVFISKKMIAFLENCLEMSENKSQALQVIQAKGTDFVKGSKNVNVTAAFCQFLSKYLDIILQGSSHALQKLCRELILSISNAEPPPGTKEQLTKYVYSVSTVSQFLGSIWSFHPHCAEASLSVVFTIIRSTGGGNGTGVTTSGEPSVALACLMQNFPESTIVAVTKNAASDASISDESMRTALQRMVDWLSWPLPANVEKWIISLLQNLAGAHKFSILIEVTKLSVERVFEKLLFFVRDGAFAVLNHMLLSFQLSPEAFHKIVGFMPRMMEKLEQDQSPSAIQCRVRLAELMYCMMYLHPGFPDLYEPLLAILQGYPRPTDDQIRGKLKLSAWGPQNREVVDYSSKFQPRSTTGKTGLENLGNTCYMNSILQALFMNYRFRSEMVSFQTTGNCPVTESLQKVFTSLEYTTRPAYSPTQFLEVSRPQWFVPGAQQDCSEFLKFLLDTLHSEQQLAQHSAGTMSHSGAQSEPDQVVPDVTSSAAAEEGAGSRKETIIEELFGGQAVTSIRCLTCDTVSERTENFTDLHLAFPELSVPGLVAVPGKGGAKKVDISDLSAPPPLRDPGMQIQELVRPMMGPQLPSPLWPEAGGSGGQPSLKIQELIDHYLSPEKLQGENQYQCEICGCLRDAEKSVQIAAAPDYLIVVLMRFSYNKESQSHQKLLADVSYPERLQLPAQGGERDYVLTAVVVHSGVSSESGHYYCYARPAPPVDRPQQGDLAQLLVGGGGHQWFLFNDCRVSFSNFSSFTEVTKRFPKDTAYVLFYRSLAETARPPPNPAWNKVLKDQVDRDNQLYLKEQEEEARKQAAQTSSHSNITSLYKWDNDKDGGDPPSSCGGGGGLGGHSGGGHFVF